MELSCLQSKQWSYSKYSDGIDENFSVCFEELNKWCHARRLFEQGQIHPNAVGMPWPVMRFKEKIPNDGFDSLSIIIETIDEKVQGVKILGRLLTPGGIPLDSCQLELCGRQEAWLKLTIPRGTESVILELTAGCASHVPNNHFSKIVFRDCIVYAEDPLTRLANLFGSDKGVSCGVWGTSPHGYSMVYNQLFEPIRLDQFNFLEIGLQASSEHTGKTDDAPSMRMWRNYFPNAVLHGFDKNDFSFFNQENTHIFRGDQGNTQDLEKLSQVFGDEGASIIIDDGSHMASHQQKTMGALFPALAKGGLYIIEDLSWQPAKEKNNTGELFSEFIETGVIKTTYMTEKEAHYIENNISEVVILKPNDMDVLIARKK